MTSAFTLSCASAVPRSTNPEVPSPFSLPSARVWPPAPHGQWGLSVRVASSLCVVGPHGSPRSGVDANFFTVRETPEHIGVVSVAWLSSWPSVRGHSGQEPTAGRPSLPPNLDATRVVICTVSCLNGRLPLAERAAVRSDLGSGLALDRPALSGGLRARRCPKLQKTCVLLVWMRSVDDWPLARIRTRFPGVSCGR